MFPSLKDEQLSELAEVWSVERDQIIKRMLEICREEAGHTPLEAREEAIFRLAELTLDLERKIIEKKTESTSIDQINPEAEHAALGSPLVRERVENTARVLADGIWKRFLDKWFRQFPVIGTPQQNQQSKKQGRIRPRAKSAGVRNQHYSPVFSNRYWAVKPKNLLRVYHCGLDGRIQFRDQGYRTWGREIFLYSQRLEKLFQVIEGDAKAPYKKLLDIIPLGETERRFWIAFLISQLLRTPSFALQFLPGLKDLLERRQIKYQTDVASLRRAYETLFTNNDVFAAFYLLITKGQWELWTAPSSSQFIRSDNPILIRGSSAKGTWQLLYPMTPFRCFVAGPDRVNNSMTVVPHNRQLNELQVVVVNSWMAQSTRKSVIAMPVKNDSSLILLLQDSLCRQSSTSDWGAIIGTEFWGAIE